MGRPGAASSLSSGPRNGPQTPNRSARPGEAGTRLETALFPFDGDDAAVRLDAGRRGRVLDRFGHDQSGTKSYVFSTLGYRGDELDPAAARRIFVAGASVAFGSGLDAGEAWPALFRRAYADAHGLTPAAVNLLN